MSLKSREVRRRSAAGVIAVLACAGAAAPAHADTSSTLRYDCTYPLIDTHPLVADVTTNIPSTAEAGVENPPFKINVTAHALGDTWAGLDLTGSAVISGEAIATSTVTVPGRAPLVLKVPITIPKTPVPIDDPGAAGVTIPAFGETPAITFPNPGVSHVTVDGLKMNITAVKDGGAPVTLGTDNDSDHDKNTFDVTCVGASVPIVDITIGPAVPPLDVVAPTKPGAPAVSDITTSGATLNWEPSTDNVGVTAYDVYLDGVKSQTVSGPTATLTGLSPNTPYGVTVIARDEPGNASVASAATSFTTAKPVPKVVNYAYKLTGTSALKTLATGSIPLSGSVSAALTLSTGAYTGSTKLADSAASLRALGFLPISATVGFTEVGGTSGSLADGVLTANTKQDIRIKTAKSLGISLVSGVCHTGSPSAIALKSGAGFAPTDGGVLTATYDIAPLTGCGLLNGLVSGLTSGKGNTLNVKLTPAPVTAT